MNLRSTLPEGAEISVFNLLKRLYYDDGVEKDNNNDNYPTTSMKYI